jgi:hypothetical protein
MDHLRNKSDILSGAAKLLHDKNLYPAVAYGAYYSCYQLLKYIWLYEMSNTHADMDSQIRDSRLGSHEFLINKVREYMKGSGKSKSGEHMRDYPKNPSVEKIAD